MNTSSLTIQDTSIRQDSQGRFLLNDLHKAAGNNPKHKPTNFLRLDTTKELTEEINRCSDMRNAIEIKQGGINQGTYAAKELVYAYAMWVSPKFHLQVIRTFDAVVSQPVINQAHLSALQAELLKTNPRFQDVINLTRLGHSQPRIAEMLGIGRMAVYHTIRRLRDCGFVVCADTARQLV